MAGSAVRMLKNYTIIVYDINEFFRTGFRLLYMLCSCLFNGSNYLFITNAYNLYIHTEFKPENPIINVKFVGFL